jgi:heme-degrading monooxygenase HmoA
MIVEQAVFTIKPGFEQQFEQAVHEGTALLAQSPGFHSAELRRGIEDPSTYLLLNQWETLAAHTEGFRGSQRFPRWRALIGPSFAADPVVTHFTEPAVTAGVQLS